MRVRIDRDGYFPLVATVCGYVVASAEVVEVYLQGTRSEPRGAFRLRPAGEWFEAFRGRRLVTGPGRPWWIFGWNQLGIDARWATAQP
jgi:hypothetical protein